MPAVMGHELPTPGNADTPKQKKHREQVIVIGTLVLVILTFVLVMRRGSNTDAGVMSDPNAYQPDAAGGGSIGDPNAAIEGQLGALPGQLAALDQNSIGKLRHRNAQQTARLGRQSARIRKQAQRIKRLTKQEKTLQHKVNRLEHPAQHSHPKHPAHAIHVSAHTPTGHHPREKWVSVHPPTHAGKKHS